MRVVAGVVVALVGLVSGGGVAKADERCGAGAYLEPSALVGATTRITGPGERAASPSFLLEAGGGFSYRACNADRSEATRLQLGLRLSVTSSGTTSSEGAGAFGFEAAADHTIAPGWRLGAAAGVGFGNEYRMYTIGARLHYRDWGWVGIEALRVQTGYVYDACSSPSTTVDGCQSSSTGIFLGVGAEHRYVAYGTGAALAIGGVIAVILAAGLGAVH